MTTPTTSIARPVNPERESALSPARPRIPSTQAGAQSTLAWWQTRVTDAYRRYAAAKAELNQVRGELAVVQSVAAGEFEPDERYAQSSAGPWPIDLEARFSLTELGRETATA